MCSGIQHKWYVLDYNNVRRNTRQMHNKVFMRCSAVFLFSAILRKLAHELEQRDTSALEKSMN
jgi:hypothetical protein